MVAELTFFPLECEAIAFAEAALGLAPMGVSHV